MIAPALAAGRIVLCDRFVDSTRAYQGAGGGDAAGRARVDALHALMIGREADVTLILDLDPAEAHARATARSATRPGEGAAEDRFERRGPAFQAALAAAFRAIAAAEPERCALVPATGGVAAVTARLEAALAPHLPRPADRAGEALP